MLILDGRVRISIKKVATPENKKMVQKDVLPFISKNTLLRNRSSLKKASIQAMTDRYNEMISYYKIFDPAYSNKPIACFANKKVATARLLNIETLMMDIIIEFLEA